ncbi:MAG: 6-carboxytetrahydropterin synthase QueD [Candidatus Omnitrophica bacterium]|nr:6-carboxytetrahydropterin synthase QueD [Candidatus Omnitrophota bacterium]
MFEISVIMDFSAAHNLRDYKGKCENLHGHNWQVEAVFSAEQLGQSDMVMDFTLAKKILKQQLHYFDHGYINQTEYFKKYNPTSENIAKFIYQNLVKKVKKYKCQVKQVSVWESLRSKATYSE